MLNDQFGELSARRFMTQLNNIGGIQVSTVQSAQPSGFYSGSNIRLDGLSETNKEKLEASLNLHVRHYQQLTDFQTVYTCEFKLIPLESNEEAYQVKEIWDGINPDDEARVRWRAWSEGNDSAWLEEFTLPNN